MNRPTSQASKVIFIVLEYNVSRLHQSEYVLQVCPLVIAAFRLCVLFAVAVLVLIVLCTAALDFASVLKVALFLPE